MPLTLEQIKSTLSKGLESLNLNLLSQDIAMQEYYFPFIKEYSSNKITTVTMLTYGSSSKTQTLNPIKVEDIIQLTEDNIKIVISYATNLVPYKNAVSSLIQGLPEVIDKVMKHQERNLDSKSKTWKNAITKNQRLSTKLIGKELTKYGLKLVDKLGNDKASEYFCVSTIDNAKGKENTKRIAQLFPNKNILATTLDDKEVKTITAKQRSRVISHYTLSCEDCSTIIRIGRYDSDGKETYTQTTLREYISNVECICQGLFEDKTSSIDTEHLDTLDVVYDNPKLSTTKTK